MVNGRIVHFPLSAIVRGHRAFFLSPWRLFWRGGVVLLESPNGRQLGTWHVRLVDLSEKGKRIGEKWKTWWNAGTVEHLICPLWCSKDAWIWGWQGPVPKKMWNLLFKNKNFKTLPAKHQTKHVTLLSSGLRATAQLVQPWGRPCQNLPWSKGGHTC